jgi:AbrB family looped-hinge helix DNA binding protein
MSIQSKVTSQCQISVPSPVRRKLGVGPGSVLEWEEKDGTYLVRKAGKYSSADIHTAIFASGRAAGQRRINTKQAIARAIRKRHAGD